MVFQEQANGNEVTWSFNGRIQATDINANNAAISGVVSAASANIQGNVAVQGSVTVAVLTVQQSAQLPSVRMDRNYVTFTSMVRFLDQIDGSRMCTLFNTWVSSRNSNFLNGDCGLAINGMLVTGGGIQASGDIIANALSVRQNVVVGGLLYVNGRQF